MKPSDSESPQITKSGTAAVTASSSTAALQAAINEIIQPIRDFASVPKALQWGVNLPYFLEGLVYFGILTVLTKFLSENAALGDIRASRIVGVFTGGITGAMFLLGELGDRWGVRRGLLFSLLFMLGGRCLLALGETLHLPAGAGGALLYPSLLGLVLVIIGYGAFQPTAYAAVKQFTTEKTAAMGFAMLYALFNLGAFASGLLSPRVRHLGEHALPPNGITAVFWVYTAMTALGLVVTFLFLRRPASQGPDSETAAVVARTLGSVAKTVAAGGSDLKPRFLSRRWLTEHPLWDKKFCFFIFILIPVQTLFAHNWLTLPLYIERAFRHTPWVSENFEFFTNLNPLLIFVLTPLVAALTQRADVYRTMILGTAVMALPTFLLALGPNPALLLIYTVLMSVGEAMWQPRFLQYVAEIAPPGKTGMYMGVAQFPWFLTKLLTSTYSGWFLAHYCPAKGPQHTEFMWFIYTAIACVTPLALLLARNWVGADISRRHKVA